MRKGARQLRVLGFAGCLLAASAASVDADPLPRVPPSKPASPCGPGGLTLPGSATCLRIGGFVSAEASATSRGTGVAPLIVPTDRPHRAFAGSLHRPEARIDAEARTETSDGPLRAYVSVKAR